MPEVERGRDPGYGNRKVPGEPITQPLRTDVAVVGAGAAGLYAALTAARHGASVVLVSRSVLAESASYWAQGGIAAALAEGDSPDRHLADTIAAGRGASRPSAARVLCEQSPAAVRDLEELGVHFDLEKGGALALGLEGGHSARRVVHAGGSATGRRITRDLSALVATHDRIEVLERSTASAIWTSEGRCVGVVAARPDGSHTAVAARGTVVATGGLAALWQRSTNPRGAIGAGLTLAAAAGAELADLEFMQFHPTALVHDGEFDGFLITEAVRGEGALLVNGAGERFVDELAPRDEVALAVHRLREAGDEVRLDMRALDIATHFPNVAATLGRAGIDPRRDLVPVAPAAHYTMGGIATGLDGDSSLPGLLAVGECACNGLHGANRLASNSLAECFVFGRRAAVAAAALPQPQPDPEPPPGQGPNPVPPRSTREALWRCAGLVRDPERLERLVREDPFPLARAIARCALARNESRGAHQRVDHPATDHALDGMHSVVRGEAAALFRHWE
ncbi:MAG: L-aspartate oxidase [Thermoleophilaceae bacterium]|nr:L-aspartate oxidase [Thermoleophilaceae bacterium]MEA2458381.1 L-aspartate oxidase [Thermoleophilaceae bacterium]